MHENGRKRFVEGDCVLEELEGKRLRSSFERPKSTELGCGVVSGFGRTESRISVCPPPAISGGSCPTTYLPEGGGMVCPMDVDSCIGSYEQALGSRLSSLFWNDEWSNEFLEMYGVRERSTSGLNPVEEYMRRELFERSESVDEVYVQGERKRCREDGDICEKGAGGSVKKIKIGYDDDVDERLEEAVIQYENDRYEEVEEEMEDDSLSENAIYCKDCQMWLNGPLQWEDHKIGKKHKKNSKKTPVVCEVCG